MKWGKSLSFPAKPSCSRLTVIKRRSFISPCAPTEALSRAYEFSCPSSPGLNQPLHSFGLPQRLFLFLYVAPALVPLGKTLNRCLKLTNQIPLDLVFLQFCYLVKATVISHLAESIYLVFQNKPLSFGHSLYYRESRAVFKAN